MLYGIIRKNHNKDFWTIEQFEFECFGGSDVVNKLLDLENDLILSSYFFFKNAKQIHTSGGLILSIEKFGLILYFNFLQKIFRIDLILCFKFLIHKYFL